MKYIIPESRLKSFIYGYLDKHYDPDYGWLSHDEYAEYISEEHHYNFEINDYLAYVFYGFNTSYKSVRPNTLIIYPPTTIKLNDWFGKYWHPIFVQWFEDHTGLKVDFLRAGNSLDISKKELKSYFK